MRPEPSPSASEKARWGIRRLLLFGVLPYLGLVLLKLVLSVGLDNPLKPDELVYLGNARYLATGSGLVDPAGRGAYKIGYSLLLVPAFRFDDDSIGGFKAVQVLNAFLLSSIYPLAFVLAGRLRPGLADLDRVLAALCVSCYPAAILYSTTAMSANAFLPTYFAVLLAAILALTRPGVWPWAAFGAAAVYLYAIHERALGIVAAAVLTAGLSLLGRSRRRWAALAFFPCAAAAYLVLVRWLRVPGSHWQTGSYGRRVVQRVLEVPETVLVTICGQLGYLGAATFGVLFTGLVYLAWSRWRGHARWPVPAGFWLLIAVSTASVFALSVLFMAAGPAPRFTHWVYGRYNEGVLLPLLLVALLALHGDGKGRAKAVLGSSACTLGLLAALAAVLAFFWRPRIGPPFSFSASSTPIFLALHDFVDFVPATLVLIGILFLGLAAIFAARWRWGTIALTAAFLLSTAVTYRDTWVERYPATADARKLPELVRRIDPERKVILRDHRPSVFHFTYYNLSYYLPEYAFRGLPQRRRDLPGDLVVSARLDFSRAFPGARLVGLENLQPRPRGRIQSLWVLPGPLQDDLARRGWLFPEDFPGPLQPEALRSELRLPAPAPDRVRQGEPRALELEVRHLGSAPWPHHGGVKEVDQSVGLVQAWIPAGTLEPAAYRWDRLPRVLYPEESARVDVELRACERGDCLPPGPYRVVLRLAQPRDGLPAVLGSGAAELELEVLAAAGAAGDPPPPRPCRP